jgi:alginate O-acetyltransferase complex protein AlgI
VAWGGLHGIGLAVNHAVRKVRPEPRTPVLFRVLAVQVFVFFAWIFFRAADFGSAWRVLQAMPGPWTLADPGLLQMVTTTNAFFQMVFRNPAFNAGLSGLAVFLLLALVAATWRGLDLTMITPSVSRWPPLAGPMRVALAGLVILVISGRVAAGHVIQPFIYFQF